MATTSYGSPYVSGSDLVAAWPAASLTVANAIDAAGYYIGRGINAQTASYVGVITDAGKTVTMTVATSNTFTVPLNATVAYPTGTRINILNLGAGACTVTATGGVTISGTISALATNQAASVIKTATNTWSYVPFSSGAAAAVITSSTGSPTITTDGTATVYKFTGDGTLVVGTAGVVRLLGHGGGGGAGGAPSSGGGGGAGAALDVSQIFLTATTHTIKIGAGGTGCAYGQEDATAGGLSALNNVGFAGGGRGTRTNTAGGAGGSGGGAGGAGSAAAGGATTCQGFAGGASVSGAGGGGGGAGAVGVAGLGTVGGAGGAGLASDILVANTNVTRGGGGGGTSTTLGAGGSGGGGTAVAGGVGNAGTANTGSGGGGTGGGGAGTGGAGGSGVIIVRVG